VRAIDIINFINEDRFSKYTMEQIYDELGKEDFLDYIENLCFRAVKAENIEPLINMKLTPKIYYRGNGVVMLFTQSHEFYRECLEVMLVYPNNLIIATDVSNHPTVDVSVGARMHGYDVPSEATDVFSEIRKGLKHCINSQDSVEKRKIYTERAKEPKFK
jgi:hypothetical protein